MLKRIFSWIVTLALMLVTFVACTAVLPTVAPADPAQSDEPKNNAVSVFTSTTVVSGNTQQGTLPNKAPTLPGTPTETDYIVNENSRKFHEISCYSADLINIENRRDFIGSRDELIDEGYVPCENCNP